MTRTRPHRAARTVPDAPSAFPGIWGFEASAAILDVERVSAQHTHSAVLLGLTATDQNRSTTQHMLSSAVAGYHRAVQHSCPHPNVTHNLPQAEAYK